MKKPSFEIYCHYARGWIAFKPRNRKTCPRCGAQVNESHPVKEVK